LQYPRVASAGNIKCGRAGCEVVFYQATAPGKTKRPFVIACQSRKCGHKGFERADTQEDAERLWLDRIREPVDA